MKVRELVELLEGMDVDQELDVLISTDDGSMLTPVGVKVDNSYYATIDT